MTGHCLIYVFLARGRGDPHIKTFDGFDYTFNGLGEYTLVKALDNSLTVQCQMGLAESHSNQSSGATVFTGFAAASNTSDTVQVSDCEYCNIVNVKGEYRELQQQLH